MISRVRVRLAGDIVVGRHCRFLENVKRIKKAMSSQFDLLVIEYTFHPDQTAVAQLVGDMVEGLLAKLPDKRVRVLCGGVGRQSSHNGRLEVVRLGFPRVTSGTGVGRLWGILAYYIGVIIYLLGHRVPPTVLCLTSPPLIGWLVSRVVGRRGRLVHWIQDLYPDLLFDLGILRHPWLVRRFQSLMERAFNQMDHVIVIGQDMKEKLLRVYGPPRELSLIQNWGDFSGVKAPRSGDFVVGYSGNAGIAHQFDLLYEVVNQLKYFDDLRYTFRGSGPRVSEIQQAFLQLGETRVVFSDFVERSLVVPTLSECSVLVLAQSSESVGDLLPSKFYTYLMAGRPILFLGPRQSEIGRQILQNDLGFVLEESRYVGACVNWFIALRASPVLANEIGRRASRYYEQNFGFNRSLMGLLDALGYYP